VTAWDRRTFALTIAMGVLLFGVACVVSGATDEGSVAWSLRVARTAPLVPICGAVVTFLALRRAERRGEMLAFESVGVSPARVCAYAVVAAAVLGVIAAACVSSFRGPALESFFPHATARGDVRPEGNGFVDPYRGVRIDRDGELVREKQIAQPQMPEAPGRAASAAILTALLGVALPLVAARGVRSDRVTPLAPSMAIAGLMCALCMLLAQATAAGRSPAALVCVPAAALLVYATVRYRSAAW
jgi:hypothetical protein